MARESTKDRQLQFQTEEGRRQSATCRRVRERVAVSQEIFNMSDLDGDDEPSSDVGWPRRTTTAKSRRRRKPDVDSMYSSQATITSSPPGGGGGGRGRRPGKGALAEGEALMADGPRGDEGQLTAVTAKSPATADDIPLLVLSDSVVCDRADDSGGFLKKCLSLNAPTVKPSAV